MHRAGAVVEARNAAAGAMGERDLGAVRLALPGLAALLPHRLDDLRDAGRAHRVAAAG